MPSSATDAHQALIYLEFHKHRVIKPVVFRVSVSMRILGLMIKKDLKKIQLYLQ